MATRCSARRSAFAALGALAFSASCSDSATRPSTTSSETGDSGAGGRITTDAGKPGAAAGSGSGAGAANKPEGGATALGGADGSPLLGVPAILPIPAHIEFSDQPAPGVHPRLFFTAEDLPQLRSRAAAVPAAAAAVERLRREAEVLEDTPLYAALRDGQTVTAATLLAQLVDNPLLMLLGTADGGFYGQLAGAAYLAVLDEDVARQSELAQVLSRAAALHATNYTPKTSDATASDANLDLAFSYDLLYDALADAQRSDVRSLIASMTNGRRAFGVDRAPQQQSTGDKLQYDSLVLTALAIEGEAGYDPAIFEGNLEKLENFTARYGIHAAGYVHEDWGSFARGMHQGSLMLLAAARRGHDFFETGRVYQALLQPFYEALPWQPGHLAGHGPGPSFDVGSGASALYPVLSYLFPEDPLVAFAMRQTHAESGDAQQENAPLPEAIFGNAFDSDAAVAEVAESLRLPTTFFDADRGILNARSSFAPDAAVLSFDCRMDTWDLARVHADRNNFTFSAKQREWIVDGTTQQADSAWHANVSIDGIGPSDAPRMPGRWLGFGYDELFAFGSGDAALAYTYNRLGNGGPLDTGFVWQDFRFMPDDAEEDWRAYKVRAESQHLPVLYARRSVVLGHQPSPFVVVIDEVARDAATHDYEWWAPVATSLVAEQLGDDLVLRHDGDPVATTPRLLVRVLAPTAISARLAVLQTPLTTGAMASNPGISVTARAAIEPRFVVVLVALDAGEEPPTTVWDDAALELLVTRDGAGQTVTFERAADGHLAVAQAALIP